jgi:hypothetical protein
LTRAYEHALWWTALASHVVYCAAMSAGIAALLLGRRQGAVMLALQLIPGMAKGWNRARLAEFAMPEHRSWFRRYAWAHALLTPVATWLWLVSLLSSAAGNEIEWRGRRYRLP